MATACVAFVDRSGKDFYMPLKLNNVKMEHRKNRTQPPHAGQSQAIRSCLPTFGEGPCGWRRRPPRGSVCLSSRPKCLHHERTFLNVAFMAERFSRQHGGDKALADSLEKDHAEL